MKAGMRSRKGRSDRSRTRRRSTSLHGTAWQQFLAETAPKARRRRARFVEDARLVLSLAPYAPLGAQALAREGRTIDRATLIAATRAWIDAQNAYTDALLGALPGREAMKERLARLMRADAVGIARRAQAQPLEQLCPLRAHALEILHGRQQIRCRFPPVAHTSHCSAPARGLRRVGPGIGAGRTMGLVALSGPRLPCGQAPGHAVQGSNLPAG